MTNELDQEQKLIESFERGEWTSIPHVAEEMKRYGAIANANLAKNMQVNIHLSLRDVKNLQIKAADEGIPYEALLASVLHKFGAGRLIEAR